MTEVIETVWIPMSDGTQLAARLWLPESAREEPVPAVLEYIPYRRRDRTRIRDESMHPRFAAAGYAAIRVDIRGSGDSEGVMLDEYDNLETADGVDVIGWIAAQAWCNGKVGMFGKSWGAYNSFQVAAKRPPALKAIAPVMGTDDRWLEDIHYYGGVLSNDNFWWGTIMQLFNAAPPDPDIVGERWRDLWKTRLDAMTFWPAQWLEHQTHDAMWRRGSISENYADIDIPVYYFGGWADMYRSTPFRIAEHLSGPVKVMLGPWGHLYPHEAVPGPQVDFLNELLRFWDHYLKDIDTGLMDEPRFRFYLQESTPPRTTQTHRAGDWVEEASWPFDNVEVETLWLNEGTLGDVAKAGDAMSICSPQTFGSAAGDLTSFGIPGDLPDDCRIDAGGALCFQSEVLDAPLDILGQAQVELTLSANKPQAFVVVLLIDEAPDGAQSLISRGFANLMHRHSDTDPQPVVPSEKMTVTVPLHATGCRLAVGHRLMVQVASTYWPMLWPAPEPVTLTIAPGESFLALPVRKPTEDNPRHLPAPEPPTEKPAVTTVREGSMERTTTFDVTGGSCTARYYIDGGVFGPVGRMRLEDTGTELGDVSDRVYRIEANDPLSASATMDQESHFERDNWSVSIKTHARMTATRDCFQLTASVDCWEGDELFHSVEWKHEIPRNGV